MRAILDGLIYEGAKALMKYTMNEVAKGAAPEEHRWKYEHDPEYRRKVDEEWKYTMYK